jgi:ergothioneine biosynthesis protein EgtB
MWAEGIAARRINKIELDVALSDAHRHTWAILEDLAPSQWQVAYDPGINPPLWEFAHIAWFTEWWVLRDAHWNERGEIVTLRSSILPRADEWFDSGRVPHRERWSLPLPPIDEVRGYVATVLDGVRAKLARTDDTDRALYFFRLALFHEDMHGEALTYMRQTLNYSPHRLLHTRPLKPQASEIHVPGGVYMVGCAPGEGFVFDNEKWAHEVAIESLRMDEQCVSNGAYAEFVAAGGYLDDRFWTEEGRTWLRGTARTQPQRWRKSESGNWEHLWFGQWAPLPLDCPVCHINAFEAEAFCKWRGRRLPTEAEWECAASQGLIEWGGSVWEWMSEAFTPYPGFSSDPYRDYSAPWFHTHRSVRGGSLATRARMHHPRYRNFYLPERDDIFVGFRTCELA